MTSRVSIVMTRHAVWGNTDMTTVDADASLAALNAGITASMRALNPGATQVTMEIVETRTGPRTAIDGGDGSSLDEEALDHIVEIVWARWVWVVKR